MSQTSVSADSWRRAGRGRHRAALRSPCRRGARRPRPGAARQLAIGRGAAEPDVHPRRLGVDDVELHARPGLPDELAATPSTTARSARATACTGPGGTGTQRRQCGNDSGRPGHASNNAPTTYGEAPFYASVFNKIWYNPNITYAPAVDFTGHEPWQRRRPRCAARRRLPAARPRPTWCPNFHEVIYCNVVEPHAARTSPTPPSAATTASTTSARSSADAELLPLLEQHGHQRGPAEDGLLQQGPRQDLEPALLQHHAARVLQRREPRELRAGHRRRRLARHAEHHSRAPALVQDRRDAATAPASSPARRARPPRRAARRSSTDDELRLPALRPLHARRHRRLHRHLPEGPELGAHRLRRRRLLHLRGGDPELRQLVQLLPHAHGADEDRHRPRVPAHRRPLPRGLHHHQPEQPGHRRASSIGVAQVRRHPAARPGTPSSTRRTRTAARPTARRCSRVGRYYAGVTDGINNGMGPIRSSTPASRTSRCSRPTATGTTPSPPSATRTTPTPASPRAPCGAYDGGLGGASNTLADVAAYYYKTDLRTAGPTSREQRAHDVTRPRTRAPAHGDLHARPRPRGLDGLPVPTTRPTPPATSPRSRRGRTTRARGPTGTCNWPIPAAERARARSTTCGTRRSTAAARTSARATRTRSPRACRARSPRSRSRRPRRRPRRPPARTSPRPTTSSTARPSAPAKWDGEIVAQRIDTDTGNVLPADRLVGPGAARRAHHRQRRLARHLHDRRDRRRQAEDVHVREPHRARRGRSRPSRPTSPTSARRCRQCALLTAAQKASPTAATTW